MTRAEMTEIFSVFMLAWPNAETFRASSKEELAAKLGPTITLWAACLRDVDYWTAQKATVKLCQSCKFPPTIAEMREAVDAVNREITGEAKRAYMDARNACMTFGAEKAYERLPARSKKVIDAMGGMEVFAPPDKDLYAMFAFESSYETFLRGNPTGLPSARKVQKALEN